MPDVHPSDATKTAQAIAQPVQTIAGDTPNTFDACVRQGLGKQIRDRGHVLDSPA
jgi:hypothetical protein